MNALLNNRFSTLVVVFLLIGFLAQTSVQAGFEGRVVTTWLQEPNVPDRKMRLERPLAFVAADGFRWAVPKGAIVDGASIPGILWSIAGPPFVGDYRRASVVHDYHCQVKEQPWQLVHRMFYEATVADGLSKLKAKTMYAAVYIGGPRWPEPGALGATVEPKPMLSDEEMQKLMKWIESNSPSLQQIENRINRQN